MKSKLLLGAAAGLTVLTVGAGIASAQDDDGSGTDDTVIEQESTTDDTATTDDTITDDSTTSDDSTTGDEDDGCGDGGGPRGAPGEAAPETEESTS